MLMLEPMSPAALLAPPSAGSGLLLGERHRVYHRASLDCATTIDSKWEELVGPAISKWQNDVRDQVCAEWAHINTSVAAVQAQKRSMLSAAATASSDKRSKALVSLSWALLATVREQANKQLADMEKHMADKLFAVVLGAAVEHNDALAACLKQNPKAPMVACQVMRLVNRTNNTQQAWLKQQIEQHSGKLQAVVERTRLDLRRSLDGGREAMQQAIRTPWWQ